MLRAPEGNSFDPGHMQPVAPLDLGNMARTGLVAGPGEALHADEGRRLSLSQAEALAGVAHVLWLNQAQPGRGFYGS